MNVTVIAALVAAVAAIFAPLLTAIVNNRYQLKIKRIEMYEAKRIAVINEYISQAGNYLGRPATNSLNEFLKSQETIYLYAPHSTWKTIDELHSLIDSGKLDEARKVLMKVSKDLSKSVLVNKH